VIVEPDMRMVAPGIRATGIVGCRTCKPPQGTSSVSTGAGGHRDLWPRMDLVAPRRRPTRCGDYRRSPAGGAGPDFGRW
jgi:hypothetical protein